MNQRFGIALAMALSFGIASLQAEAAAPKKSESKKKAGEDKAANGAKASKKADGKAKAARKSKKDASKAEEQVPAGGGEGAPAVGAEAASASAEPKKDVAQDAGAGAQEAAQGAAPTGGQENAGAAQAQAQDEGKSAPAKEDGQGDAQKAQDDAANGQGASPTAGKAASSTRPWAEGVSPENQQNALRLFREGNTLLKDSVFGQAAVKYREALEFWDHPAIHYNMVLALLNMDRPTEVLQHLEKAMAYGPDPIDPEKFEQAKSYKTLTEAQLTHLVVRCEEPGAVVSMDGQELFTAPGMYDGFVRPGPHSILAKKEGFMNNEVSPVLIAGGKAEYDMVLILAADAVEYRNRWAVWKPWSVFGAGIVVAGVGAALHITGRNAISDYDKKVESAGSAGIDEDEVKGKKDSGLLRQKIGVAMYGVGGAAVAAGITLLVMNRARPYNPVTGELMDVSDKPKEGKADEKKDAATPASPSAPGEAKGTEVTFLPVLAPDSAGMMATFRF